MKRIVCIWYSNSRINGSESCALYNCFNFSAFQSDSSRPPQRQGRGRSFSYKPNQLTGEERGYGRRLLSFFFLLA